MIYVVCGFDNKEEEKDPLFQNCVLCYEQTELFLWHIRTCIKFYFFFFQNKETTTATQPKKARHNNNSPVSPSVWSELETSAAAADESQASDQHREKKNLEQFDLVVVPSAPW